MERKRFSGVMLLFIVLAVVLITQVVGNLGRSGDVSYSDMRAYFTAEKVKSFTSIFSLKSYGFCSSLLSPSSSFRRIFSMMVPLDFSTLNSGMISVMGHMVELAMEMTNMTLVRSYPGSNLLMM